MEHQESHKRMSLVAPLEHSISEFGVLLGDILGAHIRMTSPDDVKERITNESIAEFNAQSAEIIRISALAIIAQLINSEVLVYGEQIRKAMIVR